MITKRDLLILQEGGVDLINLVDSFLEERISKENDPQRYELLVKIYSEGWGQAVGNWVGRQAGNVLGGIGNLAGGLAQGFQGTSAGQAISGAVKKASAGTGGMFQQNPEQVAQKALDMLKNAGLLGDAELQQLTNYFKQQISVKNMNMGDRMAGKAQATPPSVSFGGHTGAIPDALRGIGDSYNPELNFYGFTQILEGQAKEAPQGRRNAECARCGNKEKAKLYDINAGKAKCSKCGGYLNLSYGS